MATVWVPGLLRDMTGGLDRVEVPGETVGEIIDALDAKYPGMKARLVEDDRLRPAVAVAVDGEISSLKLRKKLRADSQVHFLPAISGGCECAG